jgi:predicted esterase
VLYLALLLLGCAEIESLEEGVDTSLADTEPQPAALATLSSGECPAMTSGVQTFTVDGVSRSVHLIIPDDASPGMPVVFGYHGLGDSTSNFSSFMKLKQLSKSHRAVVVLPEAQPTATFTWDIMSAGANDFPMFDDLRTCLADELDVDLLRVSVTGFSAGALWASMLLMERGDTLATALILSGGTNPMAPYQTAEYQTPALLMTGGAEDVYGGIFDFVEASDDLQAGLVEDEHFVVRCDHGQGHTVPSGTGPELVESWLMQHEFGQPSPYEDGDLSDLPSYCSTVEKSK